MRERSQVDGGGITPWASAEASMSEILRRRSLEVKESRKRRRENMPVCAQWTDEMRKHFPDLQVLRAEENGHTWGEEQAQGVPLINLVQVTLKKWGFTK